MGTFEFLGSDFRLDFLEEMKKRQKEIERLQKEQEELQRKMAAFFYLRMMFERLEELSHDGKNVWEDTEKNRERLSRILSEDNINEHVDDMMDAMKGFGMEKQKAGAPVAHQKKEGPARQL